MTFDKPITGIVGPNGSGKSNISDALLWVMGEQSTKTLRGGKMEDVIFGGTQRRSQVGFAEVSLILDNSDGRFGMENTEVMLTRRYYRSGESEYYINRSQVRLKDLSELLMDTGLGRDGYSVIGQGRIADLLSTKSKDRREIFEEAAGISRYRHRKEEAERKLLQTDENLLRIGDKISELELQVEPLREQAETAKKYLKLRDELKGLEITIWLNELDKLRAQADKAQNDHDTAKVQLEKATDELEQGYADSDELISQTQKCEVDAEAVRELISSAEARQNDTQSAIAVLKSQLEGNTGQISHLSTELENQDNTHDGVGTKISERQERLAQIEAAKLELEEKSEKQTEKLMEVNSAASKTSDELAALIDNETKLTEDIQEGKGKLSALASQAQELYDLDNSTKQKRADALENLNKFKEQYDTHAKALIEAREEVVSLGNIVSGLKLKSDNRTKKAEESKEKLEKLTHALNSFEQRKALLLDMEKEYQGYSKAVKMVMQESSRGALKNIHGTVAGLLKTGEKFTAAIETALGGAMQNIIVDTEEDGKAAINLLKSKDGGRATFLPISTVKGNILNERNVEENNGFEGIAYDLVEFDEKYAGIYANLLGRVVIADNLNSAIAMAKKHGQRFRIVTLDGQVINSGGSMTGGSAVSKAGVLSRANEIGRLNERITGALSEQETAKKEYSDLARELNAAAYELETALAQLRVAEDAQLTYERDEAHSGLIVKSATEAIDSFEEEINQVNNRINQNDTETKDISDQINILEADIKAIKDKIQSQLSGQDILQNEREQIGEVMADIGAGIASLDAEKEALENTVKELSILQEKMFGDRMRQLETIDGLKERNVEILAEIASKDKLATAINEEIEKHKQSSELLKEKKLEIESRRSALSKAQQEKNNEVLAMERECARLEQNKQAAEIEEKQIVNKLWETYELTRSTALNVGTPVTNIPEAQSTISSLKKEISGLGNPNIGAIEEFERVNTRYTFLTEQRDDVEKAKSELVGIIDEITTHMQEIFTREFNIINEGFEKTFKELFGGGRASLILEDPNDVLNCGIEIEVSPPGKSLKTITLLSGGEKAFVAIAIYFAILAVRPPPFVIMDEIDAALDDANVLRFASHMRRMSTTSQMIVISHKRGTMEEADVLYGVTMQELGVSSLLMLDVDEAEKAINSKVATR